MTLVKRITKTCPYCKKEYQVYPSGAHRKYCSKKCFDAAQTTSERRKIICKRCGEKFVALHVLGKWPVYCSRVCFKGDALQPAEKECPSCGSMFLAGRASHNTADGLRIFCSVKCRHKGSQGGFIKNCVNCGKEFYIKRAAQGQRPEDSCCSEKCQREYYVLEKNSHWKGGKYIDNTSGHRRQLCKREEAVGHYLAEHRVIAAQFIGRYLHRTEMMLHLNNQLDDNRPENLFICASIREMRKRYNGSLPWPEESNLSTYEETKNDDD